MSRHRFFLAVAVIAIALGCLPSAHAATATLAYEGLVSCYQLGSAIPDFTLTANVAVTGTYRMTHTVTTDATPGTPATIYEGLIDRSLPRTVTIQGGNAYVVGRYTLTGALYATSSGTLVAQTAITITIAADCPTPPPLTPVPAPETAPADIRWSQSASPSQGVPVGEILTVTVRGINAGQRSGGSDAILRYDSATLRLLDATPLRASDWVRSRDDATGTLILALGKLARREEGGLRIRFLAVQHMPLTAMRVIRDDGQDRANPLFLSVGSRKDGPYPLMVQRTSTRLKISGRGYKPGERISLWGNTSGGKTVPIEADVHADDDEDGGVQLQLPIPSSDVTSLVVYGQSSGVAGIAMVPAKNS